MPSTPIDPLQHHASLAAHNSFGVVAYAERLLCCTTAAAVRRASEYADGAPTLLLGGGSNILLVNDPTGLTVINQLSGIEYQPQSDGSVIVVAGAGTDWHTLVQHSLARGLGGLENLALIPGTVGAAPVQNIGAYGRELQEVFVWLDALEWATGEEQRFERSDLNFGYRDSFFKQEGRGRFCILRVALRLTSQRHQLEYSYGALQETLLQKGISHITPRHIAAAVIDIRRTKLPDWRELGNAGSFFKNPLVSAAQFARLRDEHPTMPGYVQPDGNVKLAAGWLIEQCGWRGRRQGQVGCYERQALIIVNYGGATGADILSFSERVAASVTERFGVLLEREVNVY